jgi:hypothetical protein
VFLDREAPLDKALSLNLNRRPIQPIFEFGSKDMSDGPTTPEQGLNREDPSLREFLREVLSQMELKN